jgi:oral-facial-digital syndrome 1 protein
MHLDKLKELKQRESEILNRVRSKEQEIERAAYEHRQKVLADQEVLVQKERAATKQVEMELHLVKKEKERIKMLETDYLLKIKDVERLKEQVGK